MRETGKGERNGRERRRVVGDKETERAKREGEEREMGEGETREKDEREKKRDDMERHREGRRRGKRRGEILERQEMGERKRERDQGSYRA